MPLQYKVDVLEALKDAGFTTYKIQKEKILSQGTVQKLRNGEGIGWDNIERICGLLKCQPGDLIEFVNDID